MSPPHTAVAGGLVAIAGLVAGCSGERAGQASPPRPNILLVSIDTLRADRVTPALTPAIQVLAERGTVFTHARTVAPLTLPAHVSLMTGAIPPRHGVRLNGVHRFDGRMPTLAVRFKEAGYDTAAVVGAYVLDRRFGLDAGFDVYDDRIPRAPEATQRLEAERRGDTVIDVALGWLKARGPAQREQPWFLWIHLYDPHAPYAPPAEWLARAGGRAYDGEVAFADAQLGRLLGAIDGAGLRARTVVAVIGDHGESLGDHGEPTHGMLLYDAALRVPLVIAGPGVRAAKRDEPVSLTALAPTLLTLAGLSGRASGDCSLVATPPCPNEPYAETDYPTLAGWSPLASLADRRWKLVDGPQPELYDLALDPAERASVAAKQSAIVNAMRARLGVLRAPEGRPASSPLTAEAAARLRALGYVAVSPGRSSGTSQVNPADMMQAWSAFESALADLGAGRTAQALASLRRLAAGHEESPVFHATLARALADAGRHAEALAIYRRAVSHWPDDAMLFHDLAVSARAAGLVTEARRAEEAAIVLDPSNAAAHDGLGLLLAGQGDTAGARRAFERALELDPTNAKHHSNVGNAVRAAGDLDSADRAYRRALELEPNQPDALNGLAAVLVQRGQPRAAIPLLQRALDRDPAFVEARLNLGIAAQEAGDPEAARAAYRQVLRAPARFARERNAAASLLASLPR